MEKKKLAIAGLFIVMLLVGATAHISTSQAWMGPDDRDPNCGYAQSHCLNECNAVWGRYPADGTPAYQARYNCIASCIGAYHDQTGCDYYTHYED